MNFFVFFMQDLLLRPDANHLRSFVSINPVFIDGFRRKNAFVLLNTPVSSERINDFWRFVDDYEVISIVDLGETWETLVAMEEETDRGAGANRTRSWSRVGQARKEEDTTFRAETVSLTEYDGISIRVVRLEKSKKVAGERKVSIRRIRQFSVPLSSLSLLSEEPEMSDSAKGSDASYKDYTDGAEGYEQVHQYHGDGGRNGANDEDYDDENNNSGHSSGSKCSSVPPQTSSNKFAMRDGRDRTNSGSQNMVGVTSTNKFAMRDGRDRTNSGSQNMVGVTSTNKFAMRDGRDRTSSGSQNMVGVTSTNKFAMRDGRDRTNSGSQNMVEVTSTNKFAMRDGRNRTNSGSQNMVGVASSNTFVTRDGRDRSSSGSQNMVGVTSSNKFAMRDGRDRTNSGSQNMVEGRRIQTQLLSKFGDSNLGTAVFFMPQDQHIECPQSDGCVPATTAKWKSQRFQLSKSKAKKSRCFWPLDYRKIHSQRPLYLDSGRTLPGRKCTKYTGSKRSRFYFTHRSRRQISDSLRVVPLAHQGISSNPESLALHLPFSPSPESSGSSIASEIADSVKDVFHSMEDGLSATFSRHGSEKQRRFSKPLSSGRSRDAGVTFSYLPFDAENVMNRGIRYAESSPFPAELSENEENATSANVAENSWKDKNVNSGGRSDSDAERDPPRKLNKKQRRFSATR